MTIFKNKITSYFYNKFHTVTLYTTIRIQNIKHFLLNKKKKEELNFSNYLKNYSFEETLQIQ